MTPLEHALFYASRGWRVAPIPRGRKHPGRDDWQTIATTDPATITAWWSNRGAWRDSETPGAYGVCIVTGPDSGIFAVDVDPDDGGDDSLAALEATHGPLPDTVEAITGGGGRHLLFNWPAAGEVRNAASGVLGVGIDVRGLGGQIVVAPTVHPETGNRYTWELEHDPFDGYPVADAPAWMIEALTKPREVRPPRREQPATTAIRIGDPDPGEVWADEHTWPEVLEAAGWRIHSCHHDAAGIYYELWTRPGKDPDDGASASLYYGGSDVLKVFTSGAAPLRAEETYTRWGFHVTLEHGGDYVGAARAMRQTINARASGAPASPQAAGEPTPAPAKNIMPPADRPSITHNGRQLDAVTREAVAALALHNEPPRLFVRAGEVARVRDDEEQRPIVEQLATKHMRMHLADAASWWRSLKDGGATATAPPIDVVDNVLAAGAWPLPPLAGIVELPVVRPDGTFATEHGYDAATKLYHWHRGHAYQPVPDTPGPDELAAAVATIADVLCDFPWDNQADLANAWGLLLTPLIRPLVGQVPMALVDAPEPGTGKGLLVTVAATLALGRPAGLTAWPSSEEEIAKVITSTLMAGTTMVIFDNVEGMIRSGNLAAALTADVWSGRILGLSKNATVANRATWVATGNNIDVGGDLARRCYRIRLDARQAQPWKRTGFRHPDLGGWVAAHRTELLHALCTIVRSWWVAGRPKADGVSAMGGYTSWVRTVGGILEHAGVTGFLANLDAFHASADREAQAWEAFLTTWADELGETSITVAELIARMKDIYNGMHLRDALPDDLSGHFDSSGFAKRLGHALRKRTGRHYGPTGLHLVEMPKDRRQVVIYAVTARSMRLFEEQGRGLSKADENNPRASAQLDLDERGFAGSSGVTSQATSYPQNAETPDERGTEEPANLTTRAVPDEDEFW